MRLVPLLPLAFAFGLAASGCAATEDETGVQGDELSGCASDLGLDIFETAKSGRNTFGGPPTSTRNRVEAGPFVGGVAITEAAKNLVRSAKREVIVEFFDIEDDSWMAKEFAEAIRALPDTVDIHVLVNPATGKRLGFFEESRNDTRDRLEKLLGKRANLHVTGWDTAGFLGVFHSKQIVVDGRHALITDTNFQRNADPTTQSGKQWFQLATVVEGDIALTMRRDAVSALKAAGDSSAMSESSLPYQAPLGTCVAMGAYGRDARVGEDGAANLAYVGLFTKARDTVNVISPNLNDDHALDALAAATEHAQVRIILSTCSATTPCWAPWRSNSPGANGACSNSW